MQTPLRSVCVRSTTLEILTPMAASSTWSELWKLALGRAHVSEKQLSAPSQISFDQEASASTKKSFQKIDAEKFGSF